MSLSPSSLNLDRGTGPSDLRLVRNALRGERESVEEVMRRLSCVVRFVFRLNKTMGYGLPTEGLEDVVQQVYVALWPRLEHYAGTSALETWVYGFCRNCLRAEFRRRTTRLRLVQADGLLEAEQAEGEAPEERAVRLESVDLLHEELAHLDAFDREVVELRHLENKSFEQIARQKNVPPSTVKDHCYRALDKIRQGLKRRYDRK